MKTIRTTTFEHGIDGQVVKETVVTEELPSCQFLRLSRGQVQRPGACDVMSYVCLLRDESDQAARRVLLCTSSECTPESHARAVRFDLLNAYDEGWLAARRQFSSPDTDNEREAGA